jgi:hypothetical protein
MINLEPEVWGPSYWTTLHYMSSSYDNTPNLNIKSTMKNFIYSLPVFLPCKECQDHAFAFIKLSNLDKAVENRKELFIFFYTFHNEVNKRLNKPLMKLSDALIKYKIPVNEYYLYGITESQPERHTIWNIVCLIMIILLIVYLLHKD